jgi:hypothetical protein
MLIAKCIDEIKRDVKKDLHILVSRESKGAFSPGMVMVQAWMAQTLPNARTEIVGPPPSSGILFGDRGTSLWLDWTDEDLTLFKSRWEANGRSIDDRFQRYVSRYRKTD